MNWILALLIMFAANNVFAQAHDFRISDNDGDVLDINADGSIPIVGGGADLSAVDSNIYPETDNVYDIGSSALSFKDIYIDGIIYGGSASIAGTGASTFSGGYVVIGNDTTTMSTQVNGVGDLYVQDKLEVDGALYVDGFLYGNGSKLTGIESISGLTSGKVPVADSSTSIVDSVIYVNGGLVGIGDSSPIYALDVLGVVSATGSVNVIPESGVSGSMSIYSKQNGATYPARLNLYQTGAYATTTTEIGEIIFSGMETDSGTQQAASIQAVADSTGASSSAVPTALQFNTGTTTSNRSERMRVSSAGRVGIGTITPLATLHVGANAGTTLTSVSGINDLYVFDDVEVDGGIYVDEMIYVTAGPTTGGLIFDEGDGACTRVTIKADGSGFDFATGTCPTGM